MDKNSMNSVQPPNPIASLGLVVVFIITFFPVIKKLVNTWIQSGDHSHGLLIVPLSLYIIWHNRQKLKIAKISAGSGGWFLVAISVAIYIFSFLSKISSISYFSLVITIWAIIWALFGKEIFRNMFFPMVLLLLMIPVPAQLYSMATIPLQLIVSKASTFIASLFGVPIFREGNVLHLPERTLAVVQACSGLRSLMSLVTLCTIYGYFTLSSNLLRSLLIISSVPAAIIVNIFRVVTMILFFHLINFDLSKGTAHTIFGIIVFVFALLIVAMIRGLFSKWEIKQTDA